VVPPIALGKTRGDGIHLEIVMKVFLESEFGTTLDTCIGLRLAFAAQFANSEWDNLHTFL
jgi:hypothetical protein